MKISEQRTAVGPYEWFSLRCDPRQPSAYPPVILLHGVPAQSLLWSGVMPLLAEKGLTAIAPDWLGFGQSSKPERREFAYTPQAYGQALGDWLTALEITECSFVVQGFLSTAALAYALDHPQQVTRLALIATPLVSPVTLPGGLRQWAIPLVGDMIAQDPLSIDRTLEKSSGFVISDDRLAVYRKPWLTTSAAGRALIAATQNLQLKTLLPPLGDRLIQEWPHPTTVIWGEKDPWLPADVVKNWVQAARPLTPWEWHSIPEALHFPPEHFPQEVGDLLTRFLRQQRSVS